MRSSLPARGARRSVDPQAPARPWWPDVVGMMVDGHPHHRRREAPTRCSTSSPFALLLGMLLDQQYPMEHAFRGPAKILDRFGSLEPAEIAAADPEQFASLCAEPPAVHRFPGSMAERMQAVAAIVVEEYDGHAERIWTEARRRPGPAQADDALPGFGKQKAQIFVALLAKQLGVRPEGWERRSGDYSLRGLPLGGRRRRPASLEKVRAYKKEKKAAARCQGRPRRRRRPDGARRGACPAHQACTMRRLLTYRACAPQVRARI